MTYIGSRTAFDASLSRTGSPRANILIAGEVLSAGEELDAPTLAFSALMRGDGNLVVYRTNDWSLKWSSHTEGHPEASLRVQGNGDIVICAANGELLWRSATSGNPGAFIQLHDDGRLVAYNFNRDPLWCSDDIV